LKLGKGILF